ncbi:LamG-like jellyroll fold domain-containing protein, partial [Urechidicola vernalis]
TAPTISCPANITLGTSSDGFGNCTANVLVDNPVFNDNCSATLTWVMSGVVVDSGSGFVGNYTYPIGTTTITYTVTDVAGLTISCTQDITIEDNENPLISCPGNQNVNFNDDCQFILQDYTSFSSTSDNCNSPIVVTQSPSPGATISGAVTVTLTATDGFNNISTCTFDVIPSDNTDPIAVAQNYTTYLSVNGTINIAASDLDNGSSDNCNIVLSTVAPSSFNCSDVGDNTVTFTVYDNAGNSDTTTATVTIVDNTLPTMLCNDYVVVIDAITRAATIEASDVDNGSNDACGLASLTVFPNVFPEDINGNVYTTTTTLTATDVNGNVNTCDVTITVEPPKNQFTYLTGLIVPLNGDPASPLIEATSCPGGANTPRDVQFTLQKIGTYNLLASDVNYWEYSDDNGETWTQISGTAGTLTHTIIGITNDRFVRLNITDYTDLSDPITKTSAEAYVRFLPPDEPPIIVSHTALDICLGAPVTVNAESFFDQPNGQFGEGGEFNYAQPDGWRVDGQDGEFPASGDTGSEETWKETNSNNNSAFSGINYDTTDNTKFALAHGVGNTTTLETPVFSTIGMTSAEAIMSFYTSFYFCNGGHGYIELSFDSGNTYTTTLNTIEGHNFTDGNTTGVILATGPPGNRYMGTTDPRMMPASIDLGAYTGLSGLRVRFTFVGNDSNLGDCGDITNTTFPNPNGVSSNRTRTFASGWAIDDVGFAYAQVDDELEWTDENGTVIAIGTSATVTPITPGIREYGVTTLVNGCRTDNHSGTNFINVNASLAYAGQNYTPLASECGESALQLNAYDNTKSAVTNFDKGAWVNNLYVVPNTAAGDTDYSPTGVTGTWSVQSASSTSCGNSAIFSSNTDPDAVFNADPGNYTLRWTLNDGSGCYDEIEVTLTDCPTVDFDGVNDYVTFKNNYNLNSEFSIEAWVKPNSVNGTSTVFSRKDFGDNSNGYDLSINNGQVTFNWFGTTSGSVSSGDIIDNDRWYHLAVTFDGSTYVLFVDGIQLNSSSGSAPNQTPSNIEALIGAMDQSVSNDPINYFHGWMDELRIWNKALNVEHIRQMMNQEIEALGSDVGGVVIPLKIFGEDTNSDGIEEDQLLWSHLDGYYRMNVACGYLSPYKGISGRLRNITT